MKVSPNLTLSLALCLLAAQAASLECDHGFYIKG